MKTTAFIGQKGYPPEFEGTSGIEFYIDRHIKEHKINSAPPIVYVRSWAAQSNTGGSGYVRLVCLPSINTKHLDALSHSFLSSVHVCFTKADTVWYQAMGPAVWAWMPKLFGKRIKTTIHGLDWKRKKWGLLARLFLRFSEIIAVYFSDELIVVSKDQQKYFQKKYNIKPLLDEPRDVVKKGVSPSIITKKHGLKGGDYILFMGRFVHEKRVDWLIKAYQEINPKNIKLVLAGGSSHSNEYVKSIKKLSKKNKNIIFTGWAFGKEKNELLNNCRLFVLPSELEGGPVVLQEALSFQKTCLVSRGISKKHRLVREFENSYTQFLHQLERLLRV